MPGRKRVTGRRRLGLLAALAAAFAISGLLRLGQIGAPLLGPSPAIAAGDGGARGAAGPDSALRRALDEVEALRAELREREATLSERETAVTAAQTLIEERLAELEAAEARLTELVAVSDTAAESDIDRLTRVYETMEAEQAAALFAQMEPDFAAGFLSRMSAAASAALLSELDPQVAYAISVVLATRNAAAPTLADGP